MGPQAGLVSVVLAAGDVRLIEVSLHCVTARPQSGVIEVTARSDATLIEPVVAVQTAAVMLTLCCTATQAPVVKLSVPAAAQAAVVQVSLSRAAQAGVVEVARAAASEAQVVELKVEEAALRAGQRHEAALRVPTPQVVVVPGWCVR